MAPVAPPTFPTLISGVRAALREVAALKALPALTVLTDVSHRTLLAGDELGWRLASLADGEGCFYVHTRKTRSSLSCRFMLGVRADDLPLLELLRDSTGIGRLYAVRVTARARELRPGTKPQAAWHVSTRDDCAVLAALFAAYPLISRKRLDCAIWSEAVAAWDAQDWERMHELRDALTVARRYRAPGADPSESPTDLRIREFPVSRAREPEAVSPTGRAEA